MADLHNQPLATALDNTDRIAFGKPGQAGAGNIRFQDLKPFLETNLDLQIGDPQGNIDFLGEIDLSRRQGTYYNTFVQSAAVTFSFVSATNNGIAFLRLTSDGTNTFTFTAAESIGITSGRPLPAGTYIFRFMQMPYGVSVIVYRDVIRSVNTNGLTLLNNELFLGGDVTANLGWTLISGLWRINNSASDIAYQISPTGATAGVRWEVFQVANTNLGVLLLLNQASDGSIQLGYTIDGGTTFARGIDINNTRMTLNGFTFPETDGTDGQVLTTDGNRVLSFTNKGAGAGTPREAGNGLTLTGNVLSLGDSSLAENVTLTPDTTLTRSISVGTSLLQLSQFVVNSRVLNMRSAGPTGNQARFISLDATSGAQIGHTDLTQQATLGFSGSGILVTDTIVNRGMTGAADFSANAQDLDYVQKSYVDPGTPAQRITALTSATNATSIDFNNESRFREFSLSLSEDTTISFTNATTRSSFRMIITITGATRTITLPANVLMPEDTSNITGAVYDNVAGTLALDVGTYELKNDYTGTNDLFALTSRYV